LMQIASPDAPPSLAELYGKVSDFRNYIAEHVGRMRLPESETALVRMLDLAGDDEDRTWIAYPLITLATTAEPAREIIRELIVSDRWDRSLAEPLELAIGLCELTGWVPPELEKWRR